LTIINLHSFQDFNHPVNPANKLLTPKKSCKFQFDSFWQWLETSPSSYQTLKIATPSETSPVLSGLNLRACDLNHRQMIYTIRWNQTRGQWSERGLEKIMFPF